MAADDYFNGGKAEVIIKYSGDIKRVGEELEAEVEELGDDYAIITPQEVEITRLSGYSEILHIELPKTLSLSLNQSLRRACVAPVQLPEGYNLTGEGVLIGVIDSGIDYTHPDFRDNNGKSRILYIWDQTEAGSPPVGFKHGVQYDNNQINMALSSPRPLEVVTSTDTIGHGTAVAGIAAGNGRASGGRERGAAPNASLIIVKLGYKGFESFARTTEIMRAFKYILDKAERLGMPVAINLSYGTNNGSHSGDSLFEAYINSAAQRWKSVTVAAAGNEGAAGHHYAGRVTSGGTLDVHFAVGERLGSLYLTLWKSFVDQFSVELFSPSGGSTGVIGISRPFADKTIDGATIRAFYGQPTHYSEAQEVFFLIRKREADIPQGLWRLHVMAENIVDGRFDIWLPTLEEVGSATAFTEPSVEKTLTLPSTVQNVISVGGYNDAIDAPEPFSGRGFSRGGIYIKPDIAAPAGGIVSARAGGGYDSYTGTSMAAPFVTGAAALMLEWGIVLGNDPFLYGQRIKAFLKKGAKRSPAMSFPNSILGFGTLCLKDALDYIGGIS